MELKTQLGKRIDNAMFIYKGPEPRRPRASFWELKSIPIGDILEATLCCTLPRESDNSLSYSAFPRIETFMEDLKAFPASEWDAKDYSENPKHWPTLPTARATGWKPTKLKDLFYWGYDNSDPKKRGVRVKYSIFNVIFQSDIQVWQYGKEVAKDSKPSKKGGFPDVGGLRDERVRALPPSKTVNDSIDLGIVILVAGRFIITRNVGSVKTQREFRIMTQR
ncbi:hypothetical protein BDZ89DRAFT_1069417 [Hymenopellis radicata]|nr:hypothetical protein BDZ89DRAFT_1069417 [Hymenopellis radicata]